MRHIKPGRGPSAMGAVSSAVAVIFGIFWTITAASMGAPGFFPLFGVLFIIIGIIQVIYNLKNATGKNRFSQFDITDSNEEPDPLNKMIRERENEPSEFSDIDKTNTSSNFCPYCGSEITEEYIFCKNCGKKIK